MMCDKFSICTGPACELQPTIGTYYSQDDGDNNNDLNEVIYLMHS